VRGVGGRGRALLVVLRSHRQLAKWRDLLVSLGMFVVDLI
jgi:hypothetical protein